jgi:RHS repeat-associated protein
MASAAKRQTSHQAIEPGSLDLMLDSASWYDGKAPEFSHRWFFHQNNVGSVTRITDGMGATANSYTYSAYGRELSASEGIGNRFRYTGREWDPRANLYFYRNRWYDPQTAHFTQYDPIGHEGGINLLRYVNNNPVMLNDPTGLVGGHLIEGADCDELAKACIAYAESTRPLFGSEIAGMLLRVCVWEGWVCQIQKLLRQPCDKPRPWPTPLPKYDPPIND